MVGGRRTRDILIFGITLLALVLINVLAGKSVWQWDLTEEKRYTLKQPTVNLLEGLEEEVFVEVFLDGNFPPEFQRLQQEIKESLNNFKTLSGAGLQYRFVDPSQAKSQQARNDFYQALFDKGVLPRNMQDTRDGQSVERIIFPGAIVSYNGQDTPINFLKGNQQMPWQMQLNQSVEGVEYELASAIEKLSRKQARRVAILQGHGELQGQDIVMLLSDLDKAGYQVEPFDFSRSTNTLNDYDAVMVLKPDSAFSEREKFALDQYVVNGGKLMMFIDPVTVDMANADGEGALAFPYELKLEDMLFKYGVRINTNLVQDLNANFFPVIAGNDNQVRMIKWPYFPRVTNPSSKHPIVRNLDAVYSRFASTIDTVASNGITKTPLLFSSRYSKVLQPPLIVRLNEFQAEPDPAKFTAGPQVIAYLLEGEFTSVFENRMLPLGLSRNDFNKKGAGGKVLVVSDGDIARNELDYTNGKPHPLGYDPFGKLQFANSTFIQNALAFMIDGEGIITTRAKEIKLRPLDKARVQEDRLMLQIMNILIPILLVLLVGGVRYFWRKRKYSS